MDLLSSNYIIVLLGIAIVFHAVPQRWRSMTLAAASALVYAMTSSTAALAFVASVAGVFLIARRIDRSSSDLARRLWLALASVILLLHLVLVKMTSLSAGHEVTVQVVRWLGILGVSYYTFKLIGYLTDVYWRKYAPWTSFADFAAFAMFFPQLFAGPIQRANEFALNDDGQERAALIRAGMRRMLFGYLKKVVIADRLGALVTFIAAHQPAYSNVIWAMSYVYAIQMYADFSALTDIAIGAAGLFGIRSPENFDFPFFAATISQFWRRWHMTLTRWLADYVFTPLRMSTRNLGEFGLALSITVNMVLIGLWHGIAVGYLLFGIVHSAYLIVDTLTAQRRRRFYRSHRQADAIMNIVGAIVVFHMVVFALVLFRAESAEGVSYFVRHLLDGSSHPIGALIHLMNGFGRMQSFLTFLVLLIFAATEVVLFFRSRGSRLLPLFELSAWPRPLRWAVYYAGVVLVIALQHTSTSFIYVQF